MARHQVIGKVIVILVAGGLCGYALWVDLNEDYERGTRLTPEKYAAGYEAHKAELLDSRVPTWSMVVVMILMMFGVFAVYEVLGLGIGVIVKGLGGRDRETPPPLPQAHG